MLSLSLSAAVVNLDAPAARLSPRLPRSNASQSGERYRKARASSAAESTHKTQAARAQLFLSLSIKNTNSTVWTLMKARLGLHRPGVMSVSSYCPSRFRDQFLPVVNRTSDIIKLSKMCFISGKHTLVHNLFRLVSCRLILAMPYYWAAR